MTTLPFSILPAEECAVSDGFQSFDPLEPGWYTTEITAEQEKLSEAGHKMSELEFTISEPYTRKVWVTYNLYHPNEKAVAMARKQVSQCATAIGFVTIGDTKELVGSSVQVCLKVTPANLEKGWSARNEVTAYRSINDPPTSPGVVSAKPDALPWAKAS